MVSQWQSKTPPHIEQRSSECVVIVIGRRRDAQPFGAPLRIAHHYRHNVRLTGHYRQTCRIEDELYPRRAFLMAAALPLRSLKVPDRRGSGGADLSLLNRPLAVTFSSLLDCSKADLKVGEMHYRSHYAWCDAHA